METSKNTFAVDGFGGKILENIGCRWKKYISTKCQRRFRWVVFECSSEARCDADLWSRLLSLRRLRAENPGVLDPKIGAVPWGLPTKISVVRKWLINNH